MWYIRHAPTHRVWCEQEAAHTGCVWADIRIAHTCGRGYFMPHAQQVLLIFIPCVWPEAKMPTRPGAVTLGTPQDDELVAILVDRCSYSGWQV